MTAHYLKSIIVGALTALDEAGAIVQVLYVIKKQTIPFLVIKLRIKSSTPYFNLKGRKIYRMYDLHHLKNLRQSNEI